ncbi:hypothetical protein CPter291_4232 [Collimonas pratensis]|uniref:Uncharacterized protein n=1 Tax=Collimonas pratensis TaxID=279113 RepID=A0ABM5ZB56_9BURK|nr:hypothetical protein CPter291_4232 [Collimonas pratensis]
MIKGRFCGLFFLPAGGCRRGRPPWRMKIHFTFQNTIVNYCYICN